MRTRASNIHNEGTHEQPDEERRHAKRHEEEPDDSAAHVAQVHLVVAYDCEVCVQVRHARLELGARELCGAGEGLQSQQGTAQREASPSPFGKSRHSHLRARPPCQSRVAGQQQPRRTLTRIHYVQYQKCARQHCAVELGHAVAALLLTHAAQRQGCYELDAKHVQHRHE